MPTVHIGANADPHTEHHSGFTPSGRRAPEARRKRFGVRDTGKELRQYGDGHPSATGAAGNWPTATST